VRLHSLTANKAFRIRVVITSNAIKTPFVGEYQVETKRTREAEASSKIYISENSTFQEEEYHSSRSRPSGLMHVLSSLAQKPRSWVPIPLKAWMFGMCMYLFCVCVVLCLGRGLTTSWSLVQGVLPSVKLSWNWKSEAGAQGGCWSVKIYIYNP
jgi:hypothetical protein